MSPSFNIFYGRNFTTYQQQDSYCIFYLTDIKVKTDTNKKTNKNNIFKAPQKNTYVPTLYYTQ